MQLQINENQRFILIHCLRMYANKTAYRTADPAEQEMIKDGVIADDLKDALDLLKQICDEAEMKRVNSAIDIITKRYLAKLEKLAAPAKKAKLKK